MPRGLYQNFIVIGRRHFDVPYLDNIRGSVSGIDSGFHWRPPLRLGVVSFFRGENEAPLFREDIDENWAETFTALCKIERRQDAEYFGGLREQVFSANGYYNLPFGRGQLFGTHTAGRSICSLAGGLSPRR
jgi:hypothetical protein